MFLREYEMIPNFVKILGQTAACKSHREHSQAWAEQLLNKPISVLMISMCLNHMVRRGSKELVLGWTLHREFFNSFPLTTNLFQRENVFGKLSEVCQHQPHVCSNFAWFSVSDSRNSDKATTLAVPVDYFVALLTICRSFNTCVVLCLISPPMSSFGRRVISIHTRWALVFFHHSSLSAFCLVPAIILMVSTWVGVVLNSQLCSGSDFWFYKQCNMNRLYLHQH